jgi:PAS domain S-box-containing protein
MISNELRDSFLKDISQSKPIIEGLMAIMTDTILILDSRNHIFEANHAGLRLFGCSAIEDLKGTHIKALYKDVTEANELIESFSSGRFQDQEYTFVRRDGTSFDGSCSGIRITENDGGGNDSMLLILRDVTHLKVSEQRLASYNKRLEKNNQALDQFAYIVSHDLKAPLRAISNLSSWVLEDAGPSLSDESKSNLTMLHGRVARLEAMINGILEYTRLYRKSLKCWHLRIISRSRSTLTCLY